MNDRLNYFGELDKVRDAFPDVFLLATEACNGYIPVLDRGPRGGSWGRGELYGHDVLNDLLHGSAGWTDWNIALDLEGGPNWKGNFVDSPILVNGTEWLVQPMFFYLAHFSLFLGGGAVRVGVDSTSSAFLEAPLEAAAFDTPGGLVLVALNRARASRAYVVDVDGAEFALSIPARAIQTVALPRS